MEAPTPSEVRTIILGGLEGVDDSVISAFITTATLVASGCTKIAEGSAELQKEIIKWLTAHYLSLGHLVRSGPIIQRSLGDASESYSAPSSVGGAGFMATMYGQQAILLDTSGCLAALGKRKASFKVL